MLLAMEKKNEVFAVLLLNTKPEVSAFFAKVVNDTWKIYSRMFVNSVLYGKYRTVSTFDVRHQNAINIFILYVCI